MCEGSVVLSVMLHPYKSVPVRSSLNYCRRLLQLNTLSDNMATQDPILLNDANRFVLFPIQYPTVGLLSNSYIVLVINFYKLWQAYKDAQRSFWTVEEIDFSGDLPDWTYRLNDAERQLLSVILAFFASSDGIVAENLVEQFCAEVRIPEA